MILTEMTRKSPEGTDMIEMNSGTLCRPAGSVMMRAPFFLPLLLLAACDDGGKREAGVSTNIVDQHDVDSVPAAGNNVEEVLPEEKPTETPQSASSMPAALQGRWTGINNACGDRMADLELNITPDSLVFHESVGTVKSVSAGADGRIRVNAAFTGEGQSWTRRLELRPSANGRELTIVNDGAAVTRKRC